MADTVAQIKSRLNLSDVIGGYLKLQKTGNNFKARCPFHNEKTPSFHINTERQIWHCFGCNKGGDMFSFLQELEGIDFPEALGILAGRAGVPVERLRPEQQAERSRRGELLRISSLASAFFVKQLAHSDAGKRAREYLRERGLADETIATWQLGWAPNDWQSLHVFLKGQGFDARDVVASGLVSERNERLYDRFRGRIMFPIRDHNGQTVGFTGRIFGRPAPGEARPGGRPEGEQEAKYINTPQTALYDKSRVLYGLDLGKMAVREKDVGVLVEGNMDAIMAWQAGVTNVVATSGTALTAEQLRILGRYSKNLDFCFDADIAGAAATRRAIALAIAGSMNVRIASLDDPDCKDPADYVKKHGVKFQEVVKGAKPVVQHYVDEALVDYDPNSAASKKVLIASVGPFIKRLSSRVEASHWIASVASILRTAPADVQMDIAALKEDIVSVGGSEPAASIVTPVVEMVNPDPLEEAVLSLLMKDFGLFYPELASIDRTWVSLELGATLDELSKADPNTHNWDVFLKEREDGTWQMEFAYVKAQELWHAFDEDELGRQWRLLIGRLGQRHMEKKAREMEMEIKEAEGKQDQKRLKTLLASFSRLKQDIARLLHV